MEKPWEGIAAGAGEFVDDHHFGAVDGHGRPWRIFSFTRGEGGEKLAAKVLRVEIGNLAAGVVALIHDDAVLIKLRGELLVECDDARERGVRHMHVTDAAA